MLPLELLVEPSDDSSSDEDSDDSSSDVDGVVMWCVPVDAAGSVTAVGGTASSDVR